MKELIGRLKRIRNSTDNIGWGACEYSPFMRTDRFSDTESQYVLVVGHNVYKKIYTMFLEKFKDGVYRVSLIHDYIPDEIIAVGSDSDAIVQKVIEKLKEWFPEIRSKS